MKKTIATLFILYAGISGTLRAQEFSLHGKVSSIPDGEWIYLEADDHVIDSAVVSNGAFVFNTVFPYYPINVFLRPKDLQKHMEYKFLWIEKTRMEFDASGSGLNKAKITGSKTHDEAERKFAHMEKLEGREEQLNFEKQYIRDNPNSVVSTSALAVYSRIWGKDTTQMLYDLLSVDMKETKYGKQILQYLSVVKDPKIGDLYADFVMNDVNDKPIRFSDTFTKGNKYILLEFWGSWCGACRHGHPRLIKTYKRFKDKGFEVFGVAMETKREQWLGAVIYDKLPWINVSDLKGSDNEAVLIYGIHTYPSNYLIDENGIIVARDLRGAQLEKELERLFEKDEFHQPAVH